MARIPLYIVLVSFVQYGSSSTAMNTIQPSSTVATKSSNSLTGSTPSINNPGVSPSNTGVSTVPISSGNGTSATTSQIVATTSAGNVAASSAAPTGTPAAKKFEVTITVQETYKSAYSNISSDESIAFISNFTSEVKSFLAGKLSGITGIEVKNLTSGSVVVDFDIIANQSSNATENNIRGALEDGNGTASLGYTLKGDITVKEVTMASTSSTPSATAAGTVSPTKSAPVTKATPTSSTKGTEIWDKAIDLATPMGTFIIVVVAVALIIILLIALICVCCKYRNLKKKTQFPEHMAINNDSEWIRSSDDLLMWERNLRATEVKTTNGVTNRPLNDRRT